MRKNHPKKMQFSKTKTFTNREIQQLKAALAKPRENLDNKR